jgi:hypothetical protein
MFKDVIRYRDFRIFYKEPNFVEKEYKADPERGNDLKIDVIS